jgi:2-polyprenyl-3-methyl-5-hydroxy-6-metoxy-1,4-benzoquinol methylase
MNSRSVLDCSRATEMSQSDATIRCNPHPYCLLCGAEGHQLYSELFDWLCDVPGRWGMRGCRACGVAWLDPQPGDEEIPKLYLRYYTHHAAPATRLNRLRRAAFQSVLAKMGYPVERPKEMLPRLLSHARSVARAAALDVMGLDSSQVGTLLDVGCGNGEFIGRMRSLGWTVSGVDPDPAAVARCRGQGLQVLGRTIVDVPNTPLFDVITLNHVIEHVADPIALLRECRGRLRPETGILVMTTPNIKSLGHWWFKRNWRGLEVPRHLMLFSPAGLSECVARSGLRLRSIRTETRLARMIFAPSMCAKRGSCNIGEKVDFTAGTKCASYAFQFFEDTLIHFKIDIGEEICCVCAAPTEQNGKRK